MLQAADFRHRLHTEIMPALKEGKIVLADRYVFTGIAPRCGAGPRSRLVDEPLCANSMAGHGLLFLGVAADLRNAHRRLARHQILRSRSGCDRPDRSFRKLPSICLECN